jgi:O-methyltransferase involved in polyketide biosynthesis
MSHLPWETSAGAAGYEPISYTARKILQKRARHTNIPYAREMAEAAGVPWRVSRPREWARHLVWGRVRSGLFLQFRHDAISAALKAYPRSPVLELGAGFGTRGLAEAEEREAYIESDLPGVIAQKPRLVAAVRSGGPRPNHYFMAVNACSRDDMQGAAAFILDLKLRGPLAIVNEGILVYLSRDEQRAFRDNVRGILARCSPGGAWITPDFSERDRDGGPLQTWMTRRLTRRVGRPFNRFKSDEEVRDFLAEGGMRGEKLASPMRHDGDPEVREVAESFSAWSIKLEPPS